MHCRWTRILVFAAVFAAEATPANTLQEYDGFAYGAGMSLNAQNGGTGWNGPWGTVGGLDAAVTANSLTFGNLAATGGAVSTAGFQPPGQGSSVAYFFRSLGTVLGANNTTAYFSFLMRPDAGYGFYGGINLGNLYAGISGNQTMFGLEGPANDLSLSSTPVTQGQTVFMVVRVDFLPGNDRVSLYMNPTPGGPEPATPSALKTDLDVGTVGSVTINNYGGFTLDEFRVGSTFASVTPLTTVPGAPALTGFGLCALAAGMLLIGTLALRHGRISKASRKNNLHIRT
jgi:hypothetical protein